MRTGQQSRSQLSRRSAPANTKTSQPRSIELSRPTIPTTERLLRGDPTQRAAAAAIASHVGHPHHLTLLAALPEDDDTYVRAAVAKGLAIWAGRSGAPSAVSELLDQVLNEPGVRLGQPHHHHCGNIYSGRWRPLIAIGRRRPSCHVLPRTHCSQFQLRAAEDRTSRTSRGLGRLLLGRLVEPSKAADTAASSVPRMPKAVRTKE
ncbi:MAG: HEAT repeat domain-containing protein [Nocardioides sp.]